MATNSDCKGTGKKPASNASKLLRDPGWAGMPPYDRSRRSGVITSLGHQATSLRCGHVGQRGPGPGADATGTGQAGIWQTANKHTALYSGDSQGKSPRSGRVRLCGSPLLT